MKYHILHVFRTSIEFIKNPLIILKTSIWCQYDVISKKSSKLCVKPLIHNSSSEWRQTDIKICQELHFMKIFKIIKGFFLKRSRSYKIMQNVIFHVKLWSLILTNCSFHTEDIWTSVFVQTSFHSVRTSKLRSEYFTDAVGIKLKHFSKM